MNPVIRTLLTTGLLLSANLAQAGESRFFEVWQCSLKKGADIGQVNAANAKWVKFVNQVLPEAGITSGTVSAVVGDYDHFSIIDSYPDELAWAQIKAALKTPEGEAAGADLDNVLHCTDNTLQSYTPSE